MIQQIMFTLSVWPTYNKIPVQIETVNININTDQLYTIGNRVGPTKEIPIISVPNDNNNNSRTRTFNYNRIAYSTIKIQ